MTHDEVVYQHLLRTDFPTFSQRAFSEYHSGKRLKRNWHMDAVAHQLLRLEAGDTRRLVINLPPRSLKSFISSVAFVAWMLGRNPALNFTCVSYSSALSEKLARDCRRLMSSRFYRQTFPNTVIERAAVEDFVTTAGGGRLSTSIGGTLTGRGCDYMFIDDPIKPSEVESETVRNTCNDWVSNTALTRGDDKTTGRIVIVMQRLHEDDLAGNVLRTGAWDHLSIPAVSGEDTEYDLTYGRKKLFRKGELLHAEREPQSVLDEMRRGMGERQFSAQYLQAPVPAEGAYIKRAWFPRLDGALPRSAGEVRVQSWDCAATTGMGSDYSVCITARVQDRNIYIESVDRAKMEFPQLVESYRAVTEQHHPDFILVEDASAGQQLIQTIESSPVRGAPSPIAIKPRGDKLNRILGSTAAMQGGEVFLPVSYPGLADFEHELFGYPNVRHDDQIDALAQLILWVRERLILPVLDMGQNLLDDRIRGPFNLPLHPPSEFIY